jgi:hypothetical protein
MERLSSDYRSLNRIIGLRNERFTKSTLPKTLTNACSTLTSHISLPFPYTPRLTLFHLIAIFARL